GLARARMSRHVDARERSVPACLPASLCARHVSAPVELGRRLPEVPDVALPVLRVPVSRALLEPAAQEEPILDDDAGHALDLLDARSDYEDVHGRLSVLHALIDVNGAGPQREPWGVDARGEARRVRP